MKKLHVLTFSLFFGSLFTAKSQCSEVVFTNNFSSTAGWTNVGNGESNISGGTFNLVNAYGSAYNKDYHSLGKTLSDTYFKAECQFTINSANPSGYGVGSLIMGLTAGTLDFFSYDASGSYAATAQDAIGVDINSPSASDNNINDWDIFIASKKGSTLASSSPILAISTIGTYYVRLERTSKGMTKLSVFSDSTFTTNITGSPVTFAIDSTITGLNTVQHGTNTWGTSTRLANISIDNDNICDNGSTEGIENLSQTGSWNVYPNPNNGSFSVDFKSPLNEDITLNLYNMMGQLVLTQKETKGTTLITLNSSLSSGIYNIVLQGNSEIKAKKMVITK
ncbi:MAG TPA: T9SS type A sorting domain-containing protein [Bacteroidia bacterium]|nr:T9SS type A sorting domain-containing protein [Bacteroidia bacterium]